MNDEPHAESQFDEDGSGVRFSRGSLLRRGAVAGLATAVAPTLLVSPAADAASRAPAPLALQFLTEWEFDYLTAMAETIWPTDDLGPGARVAGVGYYIDGQLSGSWGQGHRLYLNGPFFTPADTGHGWQIPLTPADVYRAYLPGYDVYVRTTYGNPYPTLAAAQQTLALTDLQTGKATIPIAEATNFPSSSFFSLFRQNVLEGMLADPAYGGNRDMVGWKYVGFPGDPLRRGDEYHNYIFTDQAYPFANKPLPMKASYAKQAVSSAAGRTGSGVPADYPKE
jgi:gluconate 2-dehydrogenase gamma chain